MESEEERRRRIVHLYTSTDRTLKDIGNECGITGERVRQLAAKSGAARRAPALAERERRTQSKHTEISRLAREGLPVSEIAHRVGISAQSVRKVLAIHGIKPLRGRPKAPSPSTEQREELRRLYDSVPYYLGTNKHVCGTAEGRNLVDYIACLRRGGFGMVEIADVALGVTPGAVTRWLGHYGYHRSGQPTTRDNMVREDVNRMKTAIGADRDIRQAAQE